MSDFGLCATDAREPRQVRKEATVASLSVCRRSTRSLAHPMAADLRFWIFDSPVHLLRLTALPYEALPASGSWRDRALGLSDGLCAAIQNLKSKV
jgi:hypothetical protein